MILLGNQMVKKQDGSMVKLEDLGGGDISELTEKVEVLEETVGGLSASVESLEETVGGLSTSVESLEETVGGLSTSVESIENYLNSPSYSEQVLCYAEGGAARTKVTDPGRIVYVYEIDKSIGKKILSSNLFFVKSGYIGNSDVIIQMTKGVVIAFPYGNPDGKFTFQVSSSEEPENLNIVYLCGTIARI